MVVVAVVHGQLAQLVARELAGATTADPRVQLERPLAIAAFALLAGALCLRDDAIRIAGWSSAVASWHGRHASAARAPVPIRATRRRLTPGGSRLLLLAAPREIAYRTRMRHAIHAWRRDPGQRARSMPLAVLAACAALWLGACAAGDSPEAEVRAVVDEAERAAEARDVGALLDLVAADYRDDRGNQRGELRQYVRGYFVAHQSIHLLTRVDSVELPATDLARVRATVAMLGRQAESESAWDLAAEVYDFDITLAREEGDWRVTRAEWRRAGGS